MFKDWIRILLALALVAAGRRRSPALPGSPSLLAATTIAAILSVSVISGDAAGKDLKALAAIVVPAYTSMDFALVCAQDDPNF